MPMNCHVIRCLLIAVLGLSGMACLAAEPPSTAPSVAGDLSVKMTSHGVACLAPRSEPCVIHNPAGTGYRVLTPGIGLEDAGENWIVDFSKTRAGKNADEPFSFRIMGANGNVHEIKVTFSAATAPVAKSKTIARKHAGAKETN